MNDWEVTYLAPGGAYEIDWVEAPTLEAARVAAEQLVRDEGYGPLVDVRPSRPITLTRHPGGGYPLVRIGD